MPNTIELNLLENRSIVAKMQGIPLANENSYKIIAGEENATIFKVVSIPNQYADKSFTIEMVNAKGYGIEETPIVNITNYEFSLPVGMAVAGYAYVLFRAKYIENGKEVVVPFQPLKIKVWNTIPEWKKHVSNSTNVRIENGYLIINEDGKDYNLGYVKGEKGDSGDIASQKIIDDIQKEISDLYLLSNATVTGTEEITDRYTMRQTANGLNGLIDGALTKVTEIKGSTVRCENLWTNTERIDGRAVYSSNEIISASGFTLFYTSVPKNTDVVLTVINTGNAFIALSNSLEVGAPAKYLGEFTGSTPINTEDYTYILFSAWTTDFPPDTVQFMINLGSTAKPYQPYFTDLKHANISGIKSTGRNLLNLDLGLDNLLSKNNDGSYTLAYDKDNSIYGNWFPVNLKAGTYYYQREFIEDTTIDTDRGVSVTFKYADGTSESMSFWGSASWTWNFEKDVVAMRLHLPYDANGFAEKKRKVFKLWLSYVSSNDNIEPYTEDIYQLPETLDLGKYDSFNPQTGEIIRQTVQYTCTGKETYVDHFNTGYNCVTVDVPYNLQSGALSIYSYVHNGIYPGRIGTGSQKSIQFNEIKSYFSNATEFMNWLKTQYDNETPVIVDCKLETPTIEKIENAPKLYKAWQHGSETVIQGDIDNSEYGAKCEITQIYAVKKGVSE